MAVGKSGELRSGSASTIRRHTLAPTNMTKVPGRGPQSNRTAQPTANNPSQNPERKLISTQNRRRTMTEVTTKAIGKIGKTGIDPSMSTSEQKPVDQLHRRHTIAAATKRRSNVVSDTGAPVTGKPRHVSGASQCPQVTQVSSRSSAGVKARVQCWASKDVLLHIGSKRRSLTASRKMASESKPLIRGTVCSGKRRASLHSREPVAKRLRSVGDRPTPHASPAAMHADSTAVASLTTSSKRNDRAGKQTAVVGSQARSLLKASDETNGRIQLEGTTPNNKITVYMVYSNYVYQSASF